MKLSEYKPADRLVMLWKGISGTRKTTQLGEIPGSMYVFDFDGRIAPLARFYSQRDDIEYDFFGPYDFARARAQMDKFKTACPFHTVVIDSYTRFARCIINHTRVKRAGKGSKEIGGVEVNTLEDYNAEAGAGMQFLDDFVSLKAACLILMCHIQGTDYEKDGTAIGRTILSGGKKLSAAIPTVFNEVYHFESRPKPDGSSSFKVYTQNVGLDFARTTLPLPIEIDITQKGLWGQIVEAAKKGGVELK